MSDITAIILNQYQIQMKVEIKDRKKDIEYLRMALNMVEIGVDYEITDLIIRVANELKKRGDGFSIDDAVHILYEWKIDWQEYFKAKENPVNEAE